MNTCLQRCGLDSSFKMIVTQPPVTGKSTVCSAKANSKLARPQKDRINHACPRCLLSLGGIMQQSHSEREKGKGGGGGGGMLCGNPE